MSEILPTSDPLTLLERWYARQCDGDWEHCFGVHIETLDNPGWSVRIELAETPLEGRALPRVKRERSEDDWVHCWVEDGVFNGAGGKLNLQEILQFFFEWAQAESQPK